MPDHVHMMIAIPPKYGVAGGGFIKGKSAIHLARVYGERKRNFVGQHFFPEAKTTRAGEENDG
jgi:putative transposase